MPKVTPFLMFRDRAEEAVKFYVSVIRNSQIVSMERPGGDGPALITFRLDGQEFMAMDGGPHFTFSEGTSLFVNCETQDDIDRLSATLSDGGEQQPCGWVRDRYGVSWQIVPSALGELMQDDDPEKSRAVMEALLKMKKIDISALKQAHAHGGTG
ncbi:MAG: VOC family protein [Dehalococcoidia bacterium]